MQRSLITLGLCSLLGCLPPSGGSKKEAGVSGADAGASGADGASADAVPGADASPAADAAPSDDAAAPAADANPGPDAATVALRVEIRTSAGAFTVALDDQAAPETVANFLRYTDAGFYDGSDGGGATVFHRVISGFMIQGGGLLADGTQKPTGPPIAHESPNGLRNLRGAIAMARTPDPDSATSQFFVNHVDNGFLDYVSDAEPGYVVFGNVTEGMDTVDQIAATPTGGDDVPREVITIEAVTRL